VQQLTPELIFSISDSNRFNELALRIFKFQAAHCSVYAEFISYLNIEPEHVTELDQIPFLPVEFFKSHQIVSGKDSPDLIFSSSGTTGSNQSRHFVADPDIYRSSFRKGFTFFYGDVRDYAVMALLPSYQEREGSSLIYMVDDFIKTSRYPQSGYFLFNHDELYETLNDLRDKQVPTVLFGVTYALLDFLETYHLIFPDLIVIETGGMKGRRREMIREELHMLLCQGFGVPFVHSEYGMTELLSQAYSKGAGIFRCPLWMKTLIRDINDPLSFVEQGKTGGINVIDLANLYSCSFIATQDLGRLYQDGDFEVLGRFDNSDIRGCNLLVQ